MEDLAKIEKLLAQPPNGIELLEHGRDQLVIQHRTKGMGCMTLFLIVWVSGWSMGCVGMLYRYFEPVAGEQAIPLFVLAFMWLADIGVAAFLIYFVFAKRTFRFVGRTLTFEVDVLGLKKTQEIYRDDIQQIKLIKDGGESDDSFPSWGVTLEQTGKKKVSLLFRQRLEVSTWLRDLLEAWRA
ncbi:MAG: hypothetical protein ACAH95_01215 [Fimbriimonas sp.]